MQRTNQPTNSSGKTRITFRRARSRTAQHLVQTVVQRSGGWRGGVLQRYTGHTGLLFVGPLRLSKFQASPDTLAHHMNIFSPSLARGALTGARKMTSQLVKQFWFVDV